MYLSTPLLYTVSKKYIPSRLEASLFRKKKIPISQMTNSMPTDISHVELPDLARVYCEKNRNVSGIDKY